MTDVVSPVSTERATTVTLEDVVKNFGTSRVLHGLNLEIGAGEFVSLLGPSGCGKTTALRLIAGLEQLTSGVIRMNGEDVSDIPVNKRDIGMVFQSYSLFPHLNVLQNTVFGLQMRKIEKDEAGRRAMESLELVGLGEFAERYPHELSGGQQQRVALARALVTSPKVLLLDEPLSALDAKVRVQLRDEIRRLQQQVGITTIFVTHDQEEALAISDRIAVMDSGKIEQIGTPEELYGSPSSPIVAAFVGMSSLVPTTLRAGRAVIWGSEVGVVGEAADGDYLAFIRPESVHFAAATEPSVTGVVETSTFLGSFRRSAVRLADGSLVIVQHPATHTLERGDEVRLAIDDRPVVVRPVG
ncbi:MAG: ABC transporter ATP-binding protein [Propionibacteriaceae bacterium]|jgi:putative spermidine/putrescine transport system ATP-binding protein|nr:ABC transporter ATP-binding protein [Propionibacteriaceae bacterium]